MTADELVQGLQAAFDYTQDNNRDVVADPIFSLWEVAEELNVAWAYQFLVAYIHRNTTMIAGQLEDS